jgi:hypothetical protein
MAPASTNAAPRRDIVVAPRVGGEWWTGFFKVLLVWNSSAVMHIGMLLVFWWLMGVVGLGARAQASSQEIPTTVEVQDASDPIDITNIDTGNDPTLELNYNVDRLGEVSVPGAVDPQENVGILNGAVDVPKGSIPPPPGVGGGTGAGVDGPSFGPGAIVGLPGGYTNARVNGLAGAWEGRSGQTRKKMLQEGGGNAESEAAVARGLKWMALHQAPDGHWSLHEFQRHAHQNDAQGNPVFGPGAKTTTDNCGGQTTRQNDIAGTAFGLLPFLAGGQTHKPITDKEQKIDYSKTVKAGLDYLISKQDQKGYFGGDMYAHGLATIALCEAYGMTSDQMLKGPAQKAIRYIEYAQDPAGGGWRYAAHSPGDVSVTGWQLMALKSGQMAGLDVSKEVLLKCDKFLDSCETTREVTVDAKKVKQKGGYAYLPNNGETETMTAVGSLCKQYLGVSARNPSLMDGIERLKEHPPGKTGNIYYEYYATQVMHHMGGDSWDFWNKGPDGKNGIRDALIAKQAKAANLEGKKACEDGSWPPENAGLNDGGRVMWTSLSLLTLEVYYRHLPLYRRDLGVNKDMMEPDSK